MGINGISKSGLKAERFDLFTVLMEGKGELGSETCSLQHQ